MLSFWSYFLSKRMFLLVTLLSCAGGSPLLAEGSIEGNKSEDTHANESRNYQVSDPTRALGKKDRTHKEQQATSSSVASALENGKVKLKATISSLSNTFSESDPVMITFSITNVGKITATLLRWLIPSPSINKMVLHKNVFSVKYADSSVVHLDGDTVAPGNYVGALVKSASPTYEDILVLNPKQTYTVAFDLADYYAFSNGGIYTVVYDVMEAQLLYGTGSVGDVTRLISNTLQLNVAGRFKPSYSVNYAVAGTATNSFNGCSTTQQSLIITARQDALTCSNYLNDVYMSTFDPLNPNARYTEWFGPDTLAVNVGDVTNKVASMKSAFLSASMAFDCTCTDSGIYAYVYPNQPYNIYLCGAFWSAPAKGTDSKMGTLYHETSHFDIVANTDDVVYGQSGCRDLALSDPSKAVTNADSHEYFCESLILADPRPPVRPVMKPVTKPVKPAPKPAPKPAKPAPIKPAKPAPRKPAPKPVKPTLKPVKQPSRKPSVKPSGTPTQSPTAVPTQPPIAKQCLGTSCGTLEINIDYPGNDITSVISSDPQGCCNECTSYVGCAAYSWSSSDGTCYLKSEMSFPVDSPGTHSAVLGSSFCAVIENGIDYAGNDLAYIYNFNAVGVEDCCIACRLFSGCKYFTFVPGTNDCYLKSSDAGSTPNDIAVSGSVTFPF